MDTTKQPTHGEVSLIVHKLTQIATALWPLIFLPSGAGRWGTALADFHRLEEDLTAIVADVRAALGESA